MSGPPLSVRRLWRRLGPTTQQRIVYTTIGWFVVVEGLAALGASPSPVLLAAVAAAGVALAAVLDTPTDADLRGWYAGDLAGASTGRGEDHQTAALADHLALVQTSPETTEELVRRIHGRLAAVLESKVWRQQHVDLRRNADWATSLLPRDLADFYRHTPDPALLRPAALDRLLRRIEEL